MSARAETGVLSQHGSRWMLRYERRLRHAPERVWRALVEPEDLAHWFPAAIQGERKVGATLNFVFDANVEFKSGGKIVAFDPPRLLEFTWEQEVLRFELEPSGGGTLLRFLYTFGDRSVAARNGSGWHLCLERMLAHLDGSPAPDMASWPEGYSVYMAAFGLGDFPGFLQAPSPVAGLSEHAPGVQCTAYSRPDGARVIVCRATQDAAIADHAYDGDGYVAVTEGAFEMKFHGGGITLKPGMEFHIPHGLHWSGKVTAATRFVLGLGVQGKKG